MRGAVAGHQAMGGLGDDNLIRRRLLLQTRRYIGGVAHRGIVHTQVVANRTDYNHASVEPHPDGELNSLGPVLVGVEGV
jgi:hypothetical protein